MVRNLCGY